MTQDLIASGAGASFPELVAQLRLELERAVKFDSVKAIRDQAEALRNYAKSIGTAQTALNAIAEIKIRAERRMGWEIANFALNAGGRPAKTGDSLSRVSPPTLGELGIHKKWSQRWQILARMPSADFEAYLHKVKRSGEELTAAGLYRAALSLRGASSSPATDDALQLRRDLRALERAWRRAGDAARRAFLERHRAEAAPSPVYEGNVVPLAEAGR